MLRSVLSLVLGLGLTVLGQTFKNPVIFEDFADNDIFLGPDGSFYYSASNFHFSPGAPILQSWDLVNWQLIGHSVPTLDFGTNYYMENNLTAYNGGTWASTMRYNPTTNKWYWVGCVNFYSTYVYTSPSVTGPWTKSANFQPCFYDCGMLVDDDGTMYVAWGGSNVNVAQLAPDGLSIVNTQHVFSFPPECTAIEGNRMYKRNGLYYILNDCPGEGITQMWKASSPFGPYTMKTLLNRVPSPIPGTGTPVQGSLIQTAAGSWYFMTFAWDFPLGRVPLLAPITWGSDGFPVLQTVNGAWNESYPYPLPPHPTPPWIGGDGFWGNSLASAWEWNHNPDTTKFSLNNPGLTLQTVTVTNDLFHAKNTLTHRLDGQFPVGTVQIDFSNMADGDNCGLAAFKDQSAWIGVVRNGNSYAITAVQGLTQDPNNGWKTSSTGSVVGTVPIAKGQVWLQVGMDARAAGTKKATLRYSTDGNNFIQLGNAFDLNPAWFLFVGYRYAIFNYATKALGGSIKVISFVSWTL
ncbi:glycosyl hydrolase family 43 protein [Rhexocercosporidium sp. MPI-PUGE-AT-0058]|nr:glycosyl hydrolase family 43 protein [Rhexocercosporidium sp. MPI-PUGE-AT-0058]